jgi:hypothetical protein
LHLDPTSLAVLAKSDIWKRSIGYYILSLLVESEIRGRLARSIRPRSSSSAILSWAAENNGFYLRLQQKEAVRLQLKFERAIADSETAPALLPALAESLDRNFHKLVLRTFGMNPMIEIGEAVGLILRLLNICC